ncbi:MAG: LPS assembly protein LptD [Desulfobacterales bacterium]|nr:LPS assembly protein LptD [Desulfobacterales bacterium]
MKSLNRTMYTRFSAACLILLCLIFSSKAIHAAPLEDPKKIPWKITALSVSFDQKRSLYIAKDEVIITGGETRLEADYVEFSNETKDAHAKGNVLLVAGEDSITCKAIRFNLATEIGTIEQGNVFIQKNNFYIKGDTIQKTGKDTYRVENGSLTACDGDVPDWKITGKDIEVTVEGYGFAKHTVLWAKKLPTLYSPFLAFPVKTKRQTGLLAPRFGTSDRLGFEYDQPLFLALSRDTDATLSVDYMSDRGVKLGTQYRYVLTPKSKGTVYWDFLDDSKIGDSTKYGYSTTPNRTNTDRYWFRMKADQELPSGFTAKLDIDYVSDPDYLLEFKDGVTGFNATDEEFEKAFGRSLDSYDDTTRKNSITLNKSWANYSFGVQAIWYDNVIARRDDTPDTTLQTLPEISFDSTRQQLGKTGFYYTLESDVTAFYRQDTQDEDNTDPALETLVNGQRLDIYPKLYRPTTFAKSFHFTPYIGTRSTFWNTDDFTDAHGDDDNLRSRFLIDTGADLYAKLNRVFSPGFSFAEKVQHSLIPKLTYRYIPEVDQTDLPQFTDIDSIEQENKFTWTLTNTFTGKTTEEGADNSRLAKYKELLWFELAQDYNLLDEDDLDSQELNRWSDIRFKLEAYPFTYLSLDSEIHWNPYNTHFTKTDVGATLKDNRGDSIQTTLKYTKGVSQTWKTRLNIQYDDELGFYCSLEEDLQADRTVETIAGFLYKQDCWSLAMEIKEDSSSNQSIAFMIILKGIGGFGNI